MFDAVQPAVYILDSLLADEIELTEPEQIAVWALCQLVTFPLTGTMPCAPYPQTVRRTAEWLNKATSLMVWAPSTSTALSYQADVLDAVLAGLEESGWTRTAELEIEARSVRVGIEPGREHR